MIVTLYTVVPGNLLCTPGGGLSDSRFKTRLKMTFPNVSARGPIFCRRRDIVIKVIKEQ